MIAWLGGWGGLGSEACGTVTIEETVLGRPSPPQHYTDSRINNAPNPRQPFCERGLFACPGASGSGAGFRCGPHLGATKVLSENVGQETPSLQSLSASLQLVVSPRKLLPHSYGALIFATAAQQRPPDHLALVTSGAYACVPTGIFFIL